MSETPGASAVAASSALVAAKRGVMAQRLTGGASGGESPQLGRVRATAAASVGRVHDSIDRDDGMKEIDPDEHLETLGAGIPQHLAQQTGPRYVKPEMQDSVEEDTSGYSVHQSIDSDDLLGEASGICRSTYEECDQTEEEIERSQDHEGTQHEMSGAHCKAKFRPDLMSSLCIAAEDRNSSKQPKCAGLHTCSVRHSVYDSHHLDPTYRKEDLTKDLDESDPRRFQPIKAAQNEQTSLTGHDELVAKFIRVYLRHGRKDLAAYIIDRTFENLKHIQLEKYHKAQSDFERDAIEIDPRKIFHQAVENCKPLLILQKVVRGGVLYQVPVPVSPKYQTFRAMKWLMESATEKDRKVRVWDKLGFELLDAYNNEGKSVRKKQDLHRVCEANRAFAHFRW